MDALSQLSKLLPLASCLVIIFTWFKVGSFMAERNGWTELARFYRIVGAFSGAKWRYLDAKMRNEMSFYNSLVVGSNGQGFYLAPILLFRPGHPPLLVPWHDVHVQMSESSASSEWVEIRFRLVPDAWLRIKREMIKQLEVSAGAAWPESHPS